MLFEQILPKVDVFVTNGFGSVNLPSAKGVPMVLHDEGPWVLGPF
jgi:hypothetical protein